MEPVIYTKIDPHMYDCILQLKLQSKIPQTEWLKQHLFSHSFVSWKSRMKVPEALVSDEAFAPGLQMGCFDLSSALAERKSSLVSLPQKNTRLSD
jgi:hypothetical protein